MKKPKWKIRLYLKNGEICHKIDGPLTHKTIEVIEKSTTEDTTKAAAIMTLLLLILVALVWG